MKAERKAERKEMAQRLDALGTQKAELDKKLCVLYDVLGSLAGGESMKKRISALIITAGCTASSLAVAQQSAWNGYDETSRLVVARQIYQQKCGSAPEEFGEKTRRLIAESKSEGELRQKIDCQVKQDVAVNTSSPVCIGGGTFSKEKGKCVDVPFKP